MQVVAVSFTDLAWAFQEALTVIRKSRSLADKHGCVMIGIGFYAPNKEHRPKKPRDRKISVVLVGATGESEVACSEEFALTCVSGGYRGASDHKVAEVIGGIVSVVLTESWPIFMPNYEDYGHSDEIEDRFSPLIDEIWNKQQGERRHVCWAMFAGQDQTRQ